LGIAVSARLDHFAPDHIQTYKNLFVSFYRQQVTPDIAAKIAHAAKLEALDQVIDTLFNRFCHLHQLPPIPAPSPGL
jgi:hypothetical protein